MSLLCVVLFFAVLFNVIAISSACVRARVGLCVGIEFHIDICVGVVVDGNDVDVGGDVDCDVGVGDVDCVIVDVVACGVGDVVGVDVVNMVAVVIAAVSVVTEYIEYVCSVIDVGVDDGNVVGDDVIGGCVVDVDDADDVNGGWCVQCCHCRR